jgi:ADP-ribosyl-[dinitrogen reductase] hydrolase
VKGRWRMRHPNPNMLLYIGVGDAAAVPVEYVDREKYPELFEEVLKFKNFCKHPKYTLGASLYTDDTEMSVANALVLIENEPPYTKEMFADAYVREFIRGGKRKGYSHGFQMILEKSSSGQELLNNLIPTSVANGAAMRAVPIGVLRTIPEVLEVAAIQARITHDTPEGIFSARAIALMSHCALHESLPLHCFLGSYCRKYLPKEDIERFGYVFTTRWDPVRRVVATETESVAVATVHAVYDLIVGTQYHWSILQLLENVVRLGGDTDSVAAIAFGIVSNRMKNHTSLWLPPYMFVDLENGDPRTGAKYLLDVGRRLMDKFTP